MMACNICFSSQASRKKGGRETLTPAQLGILFRTLVHQVAEPWAAVLCVVQVFFADRADCAGRACGLDVFGWRRP